MTNFTKSLKSELRALKQKEKERKEVNERFRIGKKGKFEEEFLNLKIKQFSDMVDISIAKNLPEIDLYK